MTESKRTNDQAGETASDGSGRTVRRSPGLQARSRERVDQILSAAEELISLHGYEGLKMRELTRMTGLPIASIYHYFPSNAAILRTLIERHLDGLRGVIASSLERHLAKGVPPQDVPEAVTLVVRTVADHLRGSPITTALWDALRAVPELRVLDIDDTVATARLLTPYIARVAPNAQLDQLSDFSVIFVEAMQSNLTAIMHSPPDRQETLIDALGQFASATIRGLQLGEHRS